MTERKSLVEGLKATSDVDRSVEEAFVFANQRKLETNPPAPAPGESAEPREGKGLAASPLGRVPLTTRVRSDYSAALKRASLERQLNGVVPNTLQDILEEALQPWLRSHGYLN